MVPPAGSLSKLLQQAQSDVFSPVSDRQLLERFAATGDESAFADILNRHGPMLLGLCRRQLGDVHLAEDVLQATFDEVARAVRKKEPLTEYGLQRFMVEQFRGRGLHHEPPIVAVNAHSGNPHYEPLPQGSAPIKKDDLLLLDLWCREEPEGSIWADITWMAYLGKEVPARYREIWSIVAGARDAAVAFLKEGAALGKRIRGADVDEIARRHIVERGYGDRFIHRTGHSIGLEVHGNGCNIDSLETIDDRQLIPRTGFSIEPGIYLEDFGVRSEIDVYMDERGIEVTTAVQDDIIPLLA